MNTPLVSEQAGPSIHYDQSTIYIRGDGWSSQLKVTSDDYVKSSQVPNPLSIPVICLWQAVISLWSHSSEWINESTPINYSLKNNPHQHVNKISALLNI